MTALRKHGRDFAKISKDVGSKDYGEVKAACLSLRKKLLRNKKDEESFAILA